MNLSMNLSIEGINTQAFYAQVSRNRYKLGACGSPEMVEGGGNGEKEVEENI